MLDVTGWLESAGVVGGLIIIGAIIFSESGMLIGFFLPGDTLLFTAGFFAAQGKLPLLGVLLVIFFAAVAGDNVGYTIGKKTGPRLFRKKDGIIFRQEYIQKAEGFYEKHGGKAVLFARFVPIVRTFAPIVAGVGNMDRKKFVLYDIAGAAFWTASIVLLGNWLGSKIPNIDHYLLPVIGGAMLISFGPTAWHLLKEERLRAFLKHQVSRVTQRLRRSSK